MSAQNCTTNSHLTDELRQHTSYETHELLMYWAVCHSTSLWQLSYKHSHPQTHLFTISFPFSLC